MISLIPTFTVPEPKKQWRVIREVPLVPTCLAKTFKAHSFSIGYVRVDTVDPGMRERRFTSHMLLFPLLQRARLSHVSPFVRYCPVVVTSCPSILLADAVMITSDKKEIASSDAR